MQQEGKEKKRIKKEENSGITLIALIVTIIVLLILAGISITMLVGENGLIGKANWAKFVTEYGTVKEGKDLYEIEHTMEKETGKKENKKIATTGEIKGAKLSATNEETTNLQSRKYPIIENEKIENNNIVETLKETIKITENIEEITEEKVELYKIDMNLINIDIKNEYVINIKTGELYKLGGVKYQGKTYHRPDWGVTKNGEIEEGPEDTSDTIYLKIDEKKQLTTKLQNGEVEWSSSDESIVTVDQKGEITGIAKGQAIITISYKTEDTGEEPPEESEEGNGTEDGEEEETVTNTQTYTVIVEGGIPENFTLTLEDKTIYEYQTDILEAKIEGKKIATSYLEWESSDENVVKVDSKGKIKGIKQGEVTITCKWKDDETKTASCKVTVKINDKLILDKTKMNITINQTGNIIAKYKQTDVTNTANWRSEDENIVKIEKGKVQAIGIGKTKVIAEHQGETAICEITVKDYVEEIYTIEDLSLFANQVNAGNNFSGKTVRLMNDLDFKNEASYESKESAEYNDYYTNTTTWVRIGNSTTKYFSGIFNGDGNTITNLYINAAVVNQGLFGYSKGGKFTNINLKDVNITCTKYQVGSLLGYGMNVNISNCKTSGNINTTGQISNYNRTGGIVGLIGTTGGTITNCINEATIEGSYHRKGGIVGQIHKGSITNCVNKGNIISKGAHVGGIAGSTGQQSNVNYTVITTNCKNYAKIEGQCYIGGVIGMINQSSIVKNCINYNTGSVNATGYNSTKYYESEAGGIVGMILYNGENKVENCSNYANISGTYSGVGGVIGTSMKGKIINCKNEGAITGNMYGTGGILGRTGYYNSTRKIYAKSVVQNCINKGTVNSTRSTVGGISGSSNRGSEIRNCDNYANNRNWKK